MMFLAHTGIALGLAWLPHQAFRRARREPDGPPDLASSGGSRNDGRLPFLGLEPDYRLVLLGSMLPDIIDKPLGTWLLRDTLSSGRVYAHTLLFAGGLAAIGLWLYFNHRGTGWLWLAIGSAVHLALDQMWGNPSTLFWPLFGWGFPAVDTSGWVERVFLNMFGEPGVYVPEIIGAVVLAVFAVRLVARRSVASFLRTGAAD